MPAALGAIALGATFSIASVALVISGCSESTPTIRAESLRPQSSYTVRSGDTLYRIAARYSVSVGRLMSANGITDPRELAVGQTLIIPSGYAGVTLRASTESVSPFHGDRADRQFFWPVAHGQVSSGFGIRGGAMHQGVDISAPAGTEVRAADAGTVIYSGVVHGYGNTVIIRHDDHYTTVYAHNSSNLVQEGARVSRGEVIAEIGRSGRATGNNLHFEVRCDNVAHNPLAYLPQPEPDAITFASDVGG